MREENKLTLLKRGKREPSTGHVMFFLGNSLELKMKYPLKDIENQIKDIYGVGIVNVKTFDTYVSFEIPIVKGNKIDADRRETFLRRLSLCVTIPQE